MGKINCRGHENRVNLIKEFEIFPELRMKMMTGIVMSDAGARISDELYIFSVYKKSDGTYYDKILCGEHVAKDFLLLTGERRPPIFNILKSSHSAASSKQSNSSLSNTKNSSVASISPAQKDKIEWHPVNKLLYEAVMIMILVWQDTNGDSILFKELRKCLKYPDKYPFSDRLIRINSIIGKDKRKNLFSILRDLEKAGNEIREFDLALLHEAVEKTGVKSNIM